MQHVDCIIKKKDNSNGANKGKGMESTGGNDNHNDGDDWQMPAW